MKLSRSTTLLFLLVHSTHADDVVPEPFYWGARPDTIDPAIDCAARRVTLDYARTLLPSSSLGVFDALQMELYCNETRPPETTTNDEEGEVVCPIDSKSTWFVDPEIGDDTENDGSIDNPFQTIHQALSVSRSVSETFPTRTIVLRDSGINFLLPEGTATLDSRDNGLTITNCLGESPVISGGIPITGEFEITKENDNIEVVRNATGGYNIDSLFLTNNNNVNIRAIRARHPNSNSDFSHWPTNEYPANTTNPEEKCNMANIPYPYNIFGTKDCQYNASMYLMPVTVDYPDTEWMEPPEWQFVDADNFTVQVSDATQSTLRNRR